MHPVIQSAVAAQHVKDMLDHAAEDNRARAARRARPGRRWRRHAAMAAPVRRRPPRPGAHPVLRRVAVPARFRAQGPCPRPLPGPSRGAGEGRRRRAKRLGYYLQ